MKSFGTTLREAREAKGLTPSQVAHDTHMLVQIVEEMEREDFHRIPAPIYGRGFVRLYAERVGLDSAPLIAEFMDIYQGRKPPQSAIPAAPPPPPAPPPVAEPPPAVPPPVAPPIVDPPPAVPQPELPVAEPPPEQGQTESASEPKQEVTAEQPPAAPEAPTIEVPPSVRGLDLFDRDSAPPPPPVPSPAAAPAAQQKEWESPFASAYEEPVDESAGASAAQRFRAGISAVSSGVVGRVSRIPRRAWRMALLVLAALAIVALAVWGCLALYRATETPPETPNSPDPQTIQPSTQPPKTANPQNQKPPTPQNHQTIKPSNHQTTKPPAKRPPLQSTGPRIEPLYID